MTGFKIPEMTVKGRRHQNFRSKGKNMKEKNVLDEINREDNVNAIISRDEESAVSDTSQALEMAEELILQLPEDHEGRRTWLTRFGRSAAAKNLRSEKQAH